MEHQTIKKDGTLLNLARILRRDMTRQEKHLWYDFLRNFPIKIYKQRIIDHFIADFYCHQARLVIEIDGSQHYSAEEKAYDEARTKILEKYGLQVLRFSNKDIDEKFDGVCHVIEKTIMMKLAAEQ